MSDVTTADRLGPHATKTAAPYRQSAPATDIGASDQWSGLRIMIVGLCFLLNAIDGMDVVILSYIAPVLTTDWQLSPERLGIVFSASLAGMVVGCFFVAPLADHWGRRPLILTSLSIITACMLASGFARNVAELLVLRLVIGVGVGAILASMAAIAAEFAPVKERALAVSIMTAGYPLGAMLTGLAMAPLLPQFGWHMMLLGAGVISLIALPIVWLVLPESIDFLIRRQPRDALTQVNRVLTRLNHSPVATLPPRPAKAGKLNIGQIFAPNRIRATIALWVGIFMGFMSLYFVISWITKLASGAGLSLDNAIYVGAILNFGACLGTIAMGKLSTVFPQHRVGAIFLIVAAAMLVVFGTVVMPLPMVLINAFLMGVAIYGGFNAFYGLAASLYPAAVRSTGIGWAMGVGRFGAVVGPTFGGMLIGGGASLSTVMIVFAIPLIIAAIAATLSRH
ncbi:MFS transporter [Haematobacter missouriensis]|uniref:MFS transporter n=1 Tax=Haematobacter missouriensis TaxID=366616 RepID=A0A212AHQ9_9RHOB|nr:MFS transporter [Haematobacter missouriensis]KFI32418.1 MFS transporter [Haematobacter missouriensis]OWJ76510.1 MFS transporter [Haematobacter missouriensis]OWJ80955.1 MFS transporter [Haematobacter missouriensis]